MDSQLLPSYRLRRVMLYSFTIALSSFYFGYNIGSFNSCQDSVAAALHWGDRKSLFITLFTAAFPFGAMISALFAGGCVNAWGRRRVSIWSAAAGALVSAFNVIPNTYTFGLARLLSGGVAGFMATLPPIFLNDVTPMALFGRVGLIIQAALCLGIVIGEALALPLPTSHYTSHAANWLWVLVFGFPGLVMLLQIALFLFFAVHESPVWLLKRDARDRAKAFYDYLYEGAAAAAALESAEAKTNAHELNPVSDSFTEVFSYKHFFLQRKYRKMLLLSFALQFLQQWSGINAIFSYSTSMLDFPVFVARVFSLGLGLVNFVTSLVTFPFVDKYGRRVLILIGNLGCAGSLLVAGFASLYSIKALSVVTLLLFVLFFELSLGPLVWVICGEMLYDEAMSFAVLTNWSSFFLVVLTFPMLQTVGIAYCFWLYTALLLIGEVFFYFVLMETRGLTKKEIQRRITSDS